MYCIRHHLVYSVHMRNIMHALLIATLAILCGCGNGAATQNLIVVYSPHGKPLEGDIKQRFEAAHPEYKVSFLDLPGGAIFTRVQQERSRPGASVWWGGSPGDFRKAESMGLFEPYTPEWARNLPPEAKSPTGGWVATFRTPELIMYNSKKIPPAEAPKTWEDLLDPKWKGRIVIRDVRASATMKTIFGALVLREKMKAGNVDCGFQVLKKLDANTGTYAADPQIMYDQLNSSGPAAITLWNLADALLRKSLGDPFDYVIPPETIVPVEPIALIKGAANPEGAKLFFDFVNSPEQLILMARERHRLPVRTDLPQDQLPAWMKDLKIQPMQLDWNEFDKNIDEWIARWDSEIKGKS